MEKLLSSQISSGEFSFTCSGLSGSAYGVDTTTDLSWREDVLTNTAPIYYVSGKIRQAFEQFFRRVFGWMNGLLKMGLNYLSPK